MIWFEGIFHALDPFNLSTLALETLLLYPRSGYNDGASWVPLYTWMCSYRCLSKCLITFDCREFYLMVPSLL